MFQTKPITRYEYDGDVRGSEIYTWIPPNVSKGKGKDKGDSGKVIWNDFVSDHTKGGNGFNLRNINDGSPGSLCSEKYIFPA